MANEKASDSLRAEAKTTDMWTSQQSGDDDDEQRHSRAGTRQAIEESGGGWLDDVGGRCQR
jgi:hypothetical protein